MARRLLLALLATALLLVAWRAAPASEERTLEWQGLERTYRVHLPPRGGAGLPLVFAFHGGGGNPLQAERYFRFDALADREGFVVVYPGGVDGHWNDGRDAGLTPSGVDDVGFVRAVLEEVATRHGVDRGRVFATGISNGGIFSHRLAAEASDVFLAVGPVVAGVAEPLAGGFHPSHPISLVAIQGTEDPMVPYRGGPITAPGRRDRGRVLGLDASVALYLERDGIAGAPQVTRLPDADPEDGTTTTVDDYPTGAAGTRVRVYRVEGGGHTLPGRRGYLPQRVIGRTSRDFDGAEALWSFFATCPPRP